MKALLIAGEASGDLYGGRLAAGLKKRFPQLEPVGMGGARMEEAGVKLLYHYGSVAVVGVFEVLSKLKNLYNALKIIKDWIAKERPAFAVLIDFPDFNFRVARILKKKNIPIFYFISPQIWAWRGGRINFLRDHVHLMITVLPFEKDLYEKAGVAVQYVGHPLVEIVREEVARQPVYPKTGPLIGLMPGSREIEIRRHLPILFRTAQRIRSSKDVEFLLIWPPWLPLEEKEIPEYVRVVRENRYSAMQACDLSLVASGTSTLECAILGTPLFIVYRVGSVSWQLGKIVVRVPYYGLVNWVAQRLVIPEYIQTRMDPELLARDAVQFLSEPERQMQMKAELQSIVDRLGPEGAMERAVEAIVSAV